VKKTPFMTSRKFRRLTALAVICALLPCGSAWGNPPPLDRIPVPEPPKAILDQFVKDRKAAIELGKALFWEMQAGSDGVTACASCHHRAGADPIDRRARNQLHPGPDTLFGNSTVTGAQGFSQFGPNYTLQLNTADFPFFQVVPVDSKINVTPTREINDVAGSQGIRKTLFQALIADSAEETGLFVSDPVFQLDNSTNLRQVTGRNTPSVINAVFNFSNNWDGRANNIFNGATPYGPLDQNAGIWVNAGTPASPALERRKIAIPNASLASQATAPPVSDVLMSFQGRTFPQLGKKLLGLAPLALQRVHPDDSVLGAPLSNSGRNPDGTIAWANGLNTAYDQLIRAAFVDNLWNSTDSGQSITLPEGQFSQMEANFSLFWGLAIQLYEATLVSDRTPFDLFLAGNQNALSPAALNGFGTFSTECAICHSGSELTSASVGSTTVNAGRPVFTNNTTHTLIRSGQTNTPGISDTGFFNTGVRPTADDPGRGANSPFPNALDINPADGSPRPFPLSFSRLAELRALGLLPFTTPKLPANIPATSAVAVNGSFKTPGLRNVELTPPYFHNGSALTLTETVEFYSRGGNFDILTNPEKSLFIGPIGGLRGRPERRAEIAEFLKALTDERVRNETAPFDHPELRIPNGDTPDTMITLQATGGAAPTVAPALTLNPVASPTTQSTQAITGTTDASASVAVSINGRPPVFVTVAGTPTASWSFTLTGLVVGTNIVTVTAANLTGGVTTTTATIILLPKATIDGTPPSVTNNPSATLTVGGTGVVTYQYRLDSGAFSGDTPVADRITLAGLADGTHTVTVLGKDAEGHQQLAANAATVSWTVKTTAPVLTLNQVASPVNQTGQSISGTVEAGIIPKITPVTPILIGPVSVTGTAWSCLLSGLVKGTNNFTVTATDIAGNITTRSAGINVIFPDGNLKEKGIPDMTDAVRALRIALGLASPTPEELLHGDVAPLVLGVPSPDGKIDVADVLLILRKVIGLANF